MNGQFALKVLNLLRIEASAKADLGTDSRFGKTDLSIVEIEALEDKLEAEITREMAEDETITERGHQLAREIHLKYFSNFGIILEVAKLKGTQVFEVGVYGDYSPKAGQRFSRRRLITDAFNLGAGMHWVNHDDTGASFRLILDGVKTDHVATRRGLVFELPPELSLTPVGEVL